MSDERFERGMGIRKAVLGEEHVERARQNTTAFDADFQRFITETAWGTIWSRPGLDLRVRHMITLAVLAAIDKHEELEMHIRSIGRTGVTVDELREILLHVAVYAGVPAANAGFTIATRVLASETPAAHPAL